MERVQMARDNEVTPAFAAVIQKLHDTVDFSDLTEIRVKTLRRSLSIRTRGCECDEAELKAPKSVWPIKIIENAENKALGAALFESLQVNYRAWYGQKKGIPFLEVLEIPVPDQQCKFTGTLTEMDAYFAATYYPVVVRGLNSVQYNELNLNQLWLLRRQILRNFYTLNNKAAHIRLTTLNYEFAKRAVRTVECQIPFPQGEAVSFSEISPQRERYIPIFSNGYSAMVEFQTFEFSHSELEEFK